MSFPREITIWRSYAKLLQLLRSARAATNTSRAFMTTCLAWYGRTEQGTRWGTILPALPTAPKLLPWSPIFVLLFPTTVNSPTQAAERNSTPASFLTAPFSHSRGHVLQHQEAPSHWRISSRNYAKSYKKSIRVRSEKTTSFVFKLAPYFSNIIYNYLNKCIFGLNVLALHRMLYKATVKRVLSLWEQAYVARNCQTICPAMELSSC